MYDDLDDLYERLSDSLERLDRALERVETARPPDPRESCGDPADQDWRAFLDEHSELTTTEPLQLADDALLAAVPEAIRQWNEQFPPGTWVDREPLDYTWSSDVAALLAEGHVLGRATKGDVVRVGRALGRLSRAGLVRRVELKWQGAARWQPIEAGDDA
jgi:hypothetical protein